MKNKRKISKKELRRRHKQSQDQWVKDNPRAAALMQDLGNLQMYSGHNIIYSAGA